MAMQESTTRSGVPKPLIEDTADIFTDAEIRLQRGR